MGMGHSGEGCQGDGGACPGRRRGRHGIGGAIGGMAIIAVLIGVGAGGMRPSDLAERLAGIVDRDGVDRVAQAAVQGDVAAATDELAALAGSMVREAAGVAQHVAEAAGDRVPMPDGPPGPAPGDPEAAPVPDGAVPCTLPAPDTVEPVIDLHQHEGWGGHTLERHVGQGDPQLADRLAVHPTSPPAASTFSDAVWASHVISAAHTCLADPFTAWRAGPAAGRSLRCTAAFDQPVGRRLTRELAQPVPVSQVTITYGPAIHAAPGWRVTTAYPDHVRVPHPCRVLRG